ncbi:hydrophobe/amphiphile efflux-1 (HAE1) family RND transporter [Megasphaera elsdenii CAG:570]|uniref:Hydrophobe/amphiphile efflux-1 (HAE1) family RND transporter n=1 Tax=Megasphaera elsdenii CAG:570 TaxID=1263087 RepID=R7MWP5_MEGEL|nr:hydrophobe/amphiphile efflux-1 (HAE1) family RND transporter [Megasphaera elsdenii CAG:570]
MSSFFIRRPIFAIVISIIIVILGALSLLSLPIAQYPQISPPTVNLSTTYTGANATIVNQTVAQVIEDQLKGVDDMSYMSSTSSNDGSYSLSVVFSLDSDGNTDAINVQNDANLAKNSLPSDVQTQGLTVRRSSGDMVLMANLYSPNGTYNQAFLKNYADIYLLDKIQRIDGVGNVNTFGSSYAMRVWLNPEKLAERGLTVSDVVSAIKEQNMSAPAGTIGSLPAPATQEKQYSAKVEGQLTTPEQFGNIILKSASNGQFVYLKDVANIQTGTQNESSNSKINGKTGIGFGIQLSSDANALDTITEVKKVLDQAKETFPPDLDYTIVMDNTNFINASINEVKDTFVESLLLVILVVFVFLQKWRTTLIPVLAVPVSIVGTFASFKILDFTINTLTLFAMVLAIGLVVDDAIVVIENVEEHMSKDKLSAKDATEAAMKEVQGPIIATTAVLASIFIPVAFIGGVTGVLYKQFAVTITISVVISAFVALTLTPALCGILLKPDDKAIQAGPLGAFFRGFNRAFDHFKDRYTGKVGWMIRHLKYAAVFLILVTGLMGICYQVLPSTFVPDEDQGYFMASITMPEGTSLNQTIKTVDAAAEETRQIPGVKDVMTHAGGSTSNTGNLYVALEKSVMPTGMTIEWSGQSREESTSSSSTTKILIMALVFAFLCLAALYESWSMPFAVLFTVPTGIFGAVGSEYIIRQLATLFNANTSGFLNSVYMQIGVIMIIGLAAKNAILIVEFAKERVDKGIDPMEAVVIASKLRLRPILMTAFTAIIGCLPLAFASGAGAGARCGMGVAVVGGMTFATLCGLLLIPAFYIISEKMARNFWKATGLKRIKFKYRMLRR